MNTFALMPGIAEAIIAHAQAGRPDEVCGLIAGKDGAGTRVFRGRNVSPAPRVTFEMDVETVVRQLEFADAGLELAAIYHSHPYGPATLSREDLRWAELYPGVVQILCNLADATRPELRAYRVGDGLAHEIDLVTL